MYIYVDIRPDTRYKKAQYPDNPIFYHYFKFQYLQKEK